MSNNITTRLPEDLYDFVSSNFKNKQAGITESIRFAKEYFDKCKNLEPASLLENIDALEKIRAYSTHELKGMFAYDELFYIVATFNGTMITSDIRCNKGMLLAHLEDANRLECANTMYPVDYSIVEGKIKTLTPAQIDSLYCIIEDFWNIQTSDGGAYLMQFVSK